MPQSGEGYLQWSTPGAVRVKRRGRPMCLPFARGCFLGHPQGMPLRYLFSVLFRADTPVPPLRHCSLLGTHKGCPYGICTLLSFLHNNKTTLKQEAYKNNGKCQGWHLPLFSISSNNYFNCSPTYSFIAAPRRSRLRIVPSGPKRII